MRLGRFGRVVTCTSAPFLSVCQSLLTSWVRLNVETFRENLFQIGALYMQTAAAAVNLPVFGGNISTLSWHPDQSSMTISSANS